MDPLSLLLGGAGGLANLLTGGAQRKAEKQMFDAQRMDAQRGMAQQDAQFRAGLGFQKDQDRYGRAMDQYEVGRTEEADAYRRANTNTLAPARQELLGALLTRFLGGGAGAPAGGQGGMPVLKAGPAAPPQSWAQRLGSGAPVTTRADASALKAAADQPYTPVANPLEQEQARLGSQAEQEARRRAEQMAETYLPSKAADIARGRFNVDDYARQLGFDPRDPANRDKWVQAFMDDDPEYRRLRDQQAAQFGRMGAGMGGY